MTFFKTLRKTLYIQCDTEKSRFEAKTEKAPSKTKDSQTLDNRYLTKF